MKFKKILLPLSTSTLLIASGVSSVACANTKREVIKNTTPVSSWIESNSWISYIMSDVENGVTLNIPQMYSGNNAESSSQKAFNTSASSLSKEFKISFKDLEDKDESFASKEMISRLSLKNQEINNYINVKHPNSKFVIYFYQKQHSLIASLRELKTIKTGGGVQKILDNFADTTDISDSSFSQFHGHPLWGKNFIVNKHNNGNLFFNSTYDNLKTFFSDDHKPMNDNKLKLKDSTGKTFTLDPREDSVIKSMPITTPQEIKAKNNAMLNWLKDKIDNYFLNKNALLNSYPYIDYGTNNLKVMLVSADKGATIDSQPGFNGIVYPPDVLTNASELSYKVLTVEGVIPSLKTKMQPTNLSAYEADTVKVVESIFQWLADNGGPQAVGSIFRIMKKAIPLSQSLFINISPIFNKMQKQFEDSGSYDWSSTIQNLDIYKNLKINKTKLVQTLIDSKFNLSIISKIKDQMLLIDPSTKQPAFKTWGTEFMNSLSGRNQYYIMNMFWMLKSISKAIS